MKKIRLVLLAALLIVMSCNKKSKASKDPEEAYCIYKQVSSTQKTFISCEKSQEAMQQKMIQLRDAGVTSATSVKKSTCSDC